MTTNFRFTLSALTYQDLVDEARRYAEIDMPKWDFDSEVDIGRFALDIFLRAQVQEIEIANGWAVEAFLTSARQRSSVIAHAVGRGYNPISATPAIGTLSVQVAPQTPPRTYGQFEFKFSTRNIDGNNPVMFENANSFTIPSLITNLSMVVVAGESKEELYAGSGLPDQEITLEFDSVINNSARIVDNLGLEWTEVNDFVDSIATERHFVSQLQPNNQTKLIFGDDSNGMSIPSGRTLTIGYRVGGGLRTNVAPDSVKTVETQPSNVEILEVNNVEKFSGGLDAESNESIKKNAQAKNRQRQLLGRVDEVKVFSEGYPGVSRAFCQLLANTVFTTIIPEGGGAASTELKTNLQDAINDEIIMGHTAQVDDANLVPLISGNSIIIEFTTLEGFDSAEVANNIVLDMATFIRPTSYKTVDGRKVFLREFSQPLRLNDISARLQAFVDAKAIDRDFKILSPTSDVLVVSGGIITDQGSVIEATSTNTRIVTYKI